MKYEEFLSKKKVKISNHGPSEFADVNPVLFPFQADVVRWAVRKGRAAVFLDTGLGKTFVQLEWARLLDVKVLVVAPVDNGEMDNETWIEWANGIWLGISESDTLQFTTARDVGDEKHICPLQLGTIERCIKLYSNPGETVLTPFMGIGSEAYQALRFNRRAVGIELKESYYRIAVKNLREAEMTYRDDLFSWGEQQSQSAAE